MPRAARARRNAPSPACSPSRRAAKLHPSRTYYYRHTLDVDALLDACARKLAENPHNVKARSMRGTAHMKRKSWAAAVEDFTAVLELMPDVRHGACYGRAASASRAHAAAPGT